MAELKVLETVGDKKLREKKSAVREVLEEWLRMIDIDEIFILGKISQDTDTEFPNGLRSRTPGGCYSRIWWMGALESAKHGLGYDLEGDREGYIAPEVAPEGEEDV